MLDWLVKPARHKTASRRARRRREAVRILPSLHPSIGGGRRTDPFALYPCTRMHGADFEAKFNPAGSTDDLQYS